ncbi:MAG: thermostable hemolysin delta-VPH [Clostridiales bacterium]|nr:thermostable hemolysin delta-VPH [Clostridiales bacterium]
MSYFSYHNKIKKLIKEGELLYYTFVENYNGISPALVLYFKNHKPMPIRSHRFEEYSKILENQTYLKS